MIIHRANERGSSRFGWLDSRHTFSFGHYYDPEKMGFGMLRVINDDQVAPGAGFDTHSHANMEIISYVLEGQLAHRDSLGNGSVIRPGDVQRMSAGTGISHSEFNGSDSEPVHFLQIWIIPERQGLAPGYQQQHFPAASRRGRLLPVVSAQATAATVQVHQDLTLYSGLFGPGDSASFTVRPQRRGWLQLARGRLQINGVQLEAGDGVALTDPATLSLTQGGRCRSSGIRSAPLKAHNSSSVLYRYSVSGRASVPVLSCWAVPAKP